MTKNQIKEYIEVLESYQKWNRKRHKCLNPQKSHLEKIKELKAQLKQAQNE